MKRFSVRWISWCSWVISMCLSRLSRPRDAELHRPQRPPRRFVAHREGEGDDAASVARVDDAVVEEQARGVERARLALEAGDDLRLQRGEARLVDRLALACRAIAHDDLHRARRLLAAHHRGLRGRPAEDEA